MKRYYILVILVLVFACQSKERSRVTGLVADSAMVVSAHPLASRVGVDVLKKGGNGYSYAVCVGGCISGCR
jgi:gamma-glutamyltranspeptidase / glutathione hydrolase